MLKLKPVGNYSATGYDNVKQTNIQYKSIDFNEQVMREYLLQSEPTFLPKECDLTSIALFPLRFSGDKENGTFVEVGSSHWKERNNTYFLEKHFNWTGLGVEIEPHYVEEYNKNRISKCILGDAMNINWDKHFEENDMPNRIDFLQIDVDDVVPGSNLMSLLNLPLSRYRFNTIVIENNTNINPSLSKFGDMQREMLYAHGYTLVASTFQDDWWIDNKHFNMVGGSYNDLMYRPWLGSMG
jgi:hypothetical protein